MTNSLIDEPEVVGASIETISNKNLFKFLFESYGNISTMMNVSDFLFAGYSKNKFFRFIKKAIPVGIFGYDLLIKIKNFYDKKNEDAYSIKRKKIKAIFDGKDYGDCCCSDFNFNGEILEWLMTSPKSEKFKIIKYFQLSENTSLAYIDSFESFKEISILIEYEDTQYLLVCDVITVMNKAYCRLDDVYSAPHKYSLDVEFGRKVYSEYLKTLNYKENVLRYDYQVEKRPRVTDVDFNFKNIDFNKFKNEIQSSLQGGFRRGYILVGNPGTGKTSILLRLEKELIECPMIYVTPNNINSEEKMKSLFSFIHSINPCIVIFEDMDSYDLKEKNKNLGVLLNYIDNNKDRLNVVYIATINDSSGLNYSLVRPGRFDQVIEIKEPQHNDEIYEVMKTHYYRQHKHIDEKLVKPFIKQNDLSWFTYWRLKKYKFTQADYCEIVQKIILQDYEFKHKSIIASRNELIQSKKSLVKFKMKG